MLVACWSPKGGVGKSLLAATLALHLHSRGYRTLLVDLDPEKADLATLLQCPERPSVVDWPLLERGARRQGLPGTVEGPEGLPFLPGPARLADEGRVDRELTERLLGVLEGWRGPVILDLSSSLRDSTLLALERAEKVFMVITPDLLSLRAAHHFARELEPIGLEAERFRLVLNRAGSGPALDEVTEVLPFGMAGALPSQPLVAQAINRGEAATVLLKPNPFTRGVALLASREIVSVLGPPPDPDTAEKRGPGGRRAGGGRSGRGNGLLSWWRRR